MNSNEVSIGQSVKYLYKSGGVDSIIDARIVGFNGAAIGIEFHHPDAGFAHQRWLRTPKERARLSLDGVFPQMRVSLDARSRGRPKIGRGTAHVDITLSLDVIAFLQAEKERNPQFNKSRYIDELVKQSMCNRS